MDGEALSIRIAHIRAQKNMSQQELAEKIGIKRETVTMWETNKRQIKATAIIELSKALGVSADYLLGLSDVKSNDLTVKAMCEYTGLSDEAVKYLHSLKTAEGNKAALINALLHDGGYWYDDIAEDFSAALNCYASADKAERAGEQRSYHVNVDGSMTIDPISAYRFFTNAASVKFVQFLDCVGDDING